ncbi:hypothetical protein HIM_01470 [Hirsutella minnesotensis 3608]|nr:hypothetical protein HIM_01470 [Hirsutella minnesotensis 3608]
MTSPAFNSAWLRSAALRLPRCQHSHSWAVVEHMRGYATKSSARSKFHLDFERSRRGEAQSLEARRQQTMSQMQRRSHEELFKDGDNPLFPGTFVASPLSQQPRQPSHLFQYQWVRLKQWLTGSMTVLGFKLKSMPDWATRPKWKARRGKIAPTAKALYLEMLEAFAQGDRATLHRVCLGTFARKLTAALDRRDAREGVAFELVRYNKSLWYPRLLSHQMHQFNPLDKDSYTEQAVVAISSTQRAYRYNKETSETIPGSLKLQDKLEYVVLSRQTNQSTFESTPWRIWGTTSCTTLDKFLVEQAAIEKELLKRAGWDESTTK